METDERLYKEVTDKFIFEPNLDSSQIIIGVKNNIITLTGTVRNFSDKSNAVKIANKLNGVNAVVDNLYLKSTAPSSFEDNEIARATINALKWRVFIPYFDIKQVIKNGNIALTGSNI